MENYAREVAMEEEKEMIKKLFENGVDFDIVYRSVKHISKEELLSIYEHVKK